MSSVSLNLRIDPFKLSNICSTVAPLNQIKVLSFKDKGEWILETKYNIGAKKKKEEGEG